MAILDIVEFPDKRLRIKAASINTFGATLNQRIDDMLETMYEAPGIGLAATQVDYHYRLLVCDVSNDRSQPHCLINPKIIDQSGTQTYEEGCLSVPGFNVDIERADTITVNAQDRQGEFFELQVDGLLSICIQHEMDHLKGKLFVDYLSPLKRDRLRKKILKQRKQAE